MGRKTTKQDEQIGGSKQSKHQKQSKQPTLDEEGKILSWSSRGDAGALLQLVVGNGLGKGKTPRELQEQYPLFRNYNLKCFGNAVNNMRRKVERSVRDGETEEAHRK